MNPVELSQVVEIHSIEEGYFARGHVNADTFHQAVRDYNDQWIPPQGVEHAW